MNNEISSSFFDRQDYRLIEIVDDVLNRQRSHGDLKRLFNPNLHPHGIKEMAAFRELRIAYAVVNVLKNLDIGTPAERLKALNALKQEVVFCSTGDLRINAARILIQIMKRLIRERDDELQMLKLAHDFRAAANGKPNVVRALLKRYHLLEMPEEWNQVAFDGHIHDSSTKGMKSPSHLVMDAWIKGVRFITVIYYNFVRPEIAGELLNAAEIMGIKARVGIEFSARFRNKYANLIWLPRGFTGTESFVEFLNSDKINNLFSESGKVSSLNSEYIFSLLNEFNSRHRHTLAEEYGLEIPLLAESEFTQFVAHGQPAVVHLSDFITKNIERLAAGIKSDFQKDGSARNRARLDSATRMLRDIDQKAIYERFLKSSINPGLSNPHNPGDPCNQPDILKMSPAQLVEMLKRIRTGSRIVLNLSGLSSADVLEILYDCSGRITHIEIFNMKDHTLGKTGSIREINDLRLAINRWNPIELKRIILDIIHREYDNTDGADEERIARLKTILSNMPKFKAFYRGMPLKTRIGSDSASRSQRFNGMGLAVLDTLPRRVDHVVSTAAGSFEKTPVRMKVSRQIRFSPVERDSDAYNRTIAFLRNIPGLHNAGYKKIEDWDFDSINTEISCDGNVVALGRHTIEHREAHAGNEGKPHARLSHEYMNTGIKNISKVLIGFIPAFLTFALTKDWFLLAYFGAFIWFGITGFRNIVQSVLAGKGLRHNSARAWNNFVSWERIADSLLYTGFSVPLLDYLVKTILLDRGMGINAGNNTIALYGIMALVNGIYISSHNIVRGLPKQAAAGNFFRTIISIPIAIILNSLIAAILGAAGVAGVEDVLQKWAAIISKASSDLVAGFIEGIADRNRHITTRKLDYEKKMPQILDAYAGIEIMFPEENVEKMLRNPVAARKKIQEKNPYLSRIMILNALDLMYFWIYQPRAKNVFRAMASEMPRKEREILFSSLNILNDKLEIGLLFSEGIIVGKDFSKAMDFYINNYADFMKTMERILEIKPAERE